jgi:hypothetical protein
MQFGELLHRFGPEVQDRQLFIAGAFPDIATGGWDVDLTKGTLRFRQSGRECPIDIIGSEASGQWMWGWANESFAPELVHRVGAIREWGEQRGVEALSVAGFDLPSWAPGQLLSGMSCAAIVAGLLDVPGIYCCHEKSSGRRLYVTLLDQTLKQPVPEDVLLHVVSRFPQILALAGTHPHEGGITLTHWALALDGLISSYGVEGSMDGDDIVLSHEGRSARASMTAGKLTIATA